MDGFKENIRQILRESAERKYKMDCRDLSLRVISAMVAILIWEGGKWYALGSQGDHHMNDISVNAAQCRGVTVNSINDPRPFVLAEGEPHS